MATKVPQDKTKEELLSLIEGKTIHFYNRVKGRSLEELKNLYHIPEQNLYGSRKNILNVIPYTNISKEGRIWRNSNENQNRFFTFSDDTLQTILEGMPPYYGDITPTPLENLADFSLDIFSPSYPSLEVIGIESNQSSIPHKVRQIKQENMPFTEEKLQNLQDIITEKQAEIDADRSSLNEMKEKFVDEDSEWIEKIKALTELLRLTFKVYTELFTINKSILPLTTILQVSTTKRYHSFFPNGGADDFRTAFKQHGRLETDSKQLVFARAVGGLLLYLFTHVPKETVLDRENKDAIHDLFEAYAFGLLSTTMDGIAIRKHLELLFTPINQYLEYPLFVIDCENGGTTERCPRGLMPPMDTTDGHYKIVFTDVNNKAELTAENQIRLWEKYSPQTMGGRRKTHKRVQKKKRSKSRRWRK